jgi:regulatory protein
LKEYEPEEIEEALDKLRDQGLQSDQRFAQSYAEQRARNGHGPLKIKIELIQHGVSESLAETTMSALEVDWQDLARKAFEKKFPEPAKDLNEKAKRQRFMRQRGFEYFSSGKMDNL